MTRTLIVMSSLLWAVACAPVPTPLHIDKFLPIDETECKVSTDAKVVLAGGTLDVAPGSPSYTVGVTITGATELETASYSVTGGPLLEPGKRSQPIIDRLVLSYAAKPAALGLNLQAAEVPMTIPLYSGEATGMIDLISPQVATELEDKVQAGDEVTLTVTVEFKGYMTGDHAAITTGPLAFPLRVMKSDSTKCTGAIRAPVAGQCLYPGQVSTNNTSVCCADLLAGTSGCP